MRAVQLHKWVRNDGLEDGDWVNGEWWGDWQMRQCAD
jgi:hypothetical protein